MNASVRSYSVTSFSIKLYDGDLMMSVRCISFLFGAFLVGLALPTFDARGGTILVFGQSNVTSPEFTATRNANSTTLSATDVSVTITELGGIAATTSAYFSLSATNVSAATVDGFGHISEKFDGAFTIYSGEGETGTNYLSGTYSDTVFGAGTAFTLEASSAGGSSTLTFTSDVITALAAPEGLSLAFTDLTPIASVVDDTLGSFVSNVAGTFSAAVPEPASIIMLGIGACVVGFLTLPRLMRRASVTLRMIIWHSNTASLMLMGFATLFLLSGGSGQAKAGLVYDNGTVNGTINAWTINYGDSVSDSFTLSSSTDLTGAQIGLWAFPGSIPVGVEWSIGSVAFTDGLGSGTAALSSDLLWTNVFHYDIYESVVQINISLAPGTYWLTLQNATASGGDPVFWDQTNGSSFAFDSAQGAVPSESFQLYGTTVPEPGSLTLLAMGACGLIGCARLRCKWMVTYTKRRHLEKRSKPDDHSTWWQSAVPWFTEAHQSGKNVSTACRAAASR